MSNIHYYNKTRKSHQPLLPESFFPLFGIATNIKLLCIIKFHASYKSNIQGQNPFSCLVLSFMMAHNTRSSFYVTILVKCSLISSMDHTVKCGFVFLTIQTCKISRKHEMVTRAVLTTYILIKTS